MNTIPFEFTTLYRNDKKITDYFSVDVVAEINGVKAYLQIDTACPVTMLDDDFFEKYLKSDKVKKSNRIIKDNWFTTQFAHTGNVTITFNDNIVFAPQIICLEKNQTGEYAKNIKVLRRFDLPFAGYIGLDWFEKKIFEINYVNQEIYFYDTLPEVSIPKDNKLLQERKSILLPTQINECSFYSVFDTASSAYALIIEQSLFKQFFGKLTGKPYNTVIRPDFLLREYYVKKKIPIKIGSYVFNEKATITTVDSKTNAYYFGAQKEYRHTAILGNIPFLKHRILIDLKQNVFLIR